MAKTSGTRRAAARAARAPDRDKSRSLTIMLLDAPGDTPADFIHPDVADKAREYKLNISGKGRCSLFVKSSIRRPPPWATFFAGHIAPRELGDVISSAAVLVVHVRDSWFAVSFGHGRYLLKRNAIVDGFGLRVALNAVGENLRSIDKETFDAPAGLDRQQASRTIKPRDFQIDREKDLLRAVTGTPDDETIGGRITGRDSVSVSTRVTLDSLTDYLTRLRELYDSDAYRKAFPWLDQIVEIKDDGLKEQLNNELLSLVRVQDHSRTWLAPPEILDWSEVRHFAYMKSRRSGEFMDIHWKTFMEGQDRDALSIEDLQRRQVYCFGEDYRIIAHWPVFRCVYAEVELNGESFVLSAGRWYRVAGDFVAEVNDFFEKVPRRKEALPVYDDDAEDVYNRRVAASSGGHFALMDRETIHYGGGQSQIEFCDLFGRDGELVHVKRYGSSQEMTYIFAQGLASAEALCMDKRDFVPAVDGKLPKSHRLGARGKLSPDDFRITFAIISKSANELHLPLFSKISLRTVVRRLEALRYHVELAKIDVEEKRSKRRTVPPKGAARVASKAKRDVA